MSSLPPYNPGPGDRVVWLLAADSPGELPPDLPGAPPFGRVVTADANLRTALGGFSAGADVEVVPDPGALQPPEAAMLVAGPQAYVESVLRLVMAIPEGTARFVLLPGQPTVVQLLPDRAVLLRLNPGRALA